MIFPTTRCPMETKFFWALAKPIERKEIEVPWPGLFYTHMERAFGGFPIELTEKDLNKLDGMASTWSDVSVSPYVHLIQAVKRYKAVRIWVEYPTAEEKTE